MISNEIYMELKKIKKENSFGILKKDKEWEEIDKDLKRGWKAWIKRYA